MSKLSDVQHSPSFRQKIYSSAKLSGLRFLSEVGLRLVSTVVLTRFLAPDIYGVFATVLVYLYLLEMFSDFGLRSLILTKEGEVRHGFLRTCWTIAIIRGALIAVLSCAIAGVIGLLQGQQIFASDNPYAASELPWAIAALGGVAFLTGFQSPMRFLAERKMTFGKVTFVDVTVNVISLVVTIALAFYLRSVWALVLGAVIKGCFQIFFSFVAFPGLRLAFSLNRADLDIIVGRGKWIIGHSILYGFAQSADRLVLGFIMTSTTFGFYFIARQLVDIVMRFLISVDGQMGLQVFAHLHKSSVEIFRRNYYRYRLFFDALAGMATGSLFVLAPGIVWLVFDDRYWGVGPIVQTLVWSILLVGPLLLRSALTAERKFREVTILSTISTVTLWVGLIIAAFWIGSVELALFVIALYRLPEAMICILWGGDRDWVIVWREFMSFGFCVVGVLLGEGVLLLRGVLME